METPKIVGTVLLVLLLVPLLFLLLPAVLVWELAWGILLRIWFWRAHRIHGRFILFVYSESPNWQSYIEENILPQISERAVVLNWSHRKRWSSEQPWESRVIQHWAGSRDFNPLALVFVGRWHVVTIRFFQAFRDLKHGRDQALREAEGELLGYLRRAVAAA